MAAACADGAAPVDRFALCAGLSVSVLLCLGYWIYRDNMRVRGDSYYIPLGTRWWYFIGLSKLASAAVGFATITAGADVVPIVGVRLVWNAVKAVHGGVDIAFATIDLSLTPWMPSITPLLIIVTVSVTWLAPFLALAFTWVPIALDGSDPCLSAIAPAPAAALALEAASLLALPLIDYLGGGASRTGRPKCYRDTQKSEHPRVSFGRAGRMPRRSLERLELGGSQKRLVGDLASSMLPARLPAKVKELQRGSPHSHPTGSPLRLLSARRGRNSLSGSSDVSGRAMGAAAGAGGPSQSALAEGAKGTPARPPRHAFFSSPSPSPSDTSDISPRAMLGERIAGGSSPTHKPRARPGSGRAARVMPA